METARTRTAALTGIDACLVDVEAGIAGGLPATILTGLPDTALRETRDRVRAAIINSGERWPGATITVSLSPARLPKRGSAFDLAIAIAVLAAAHAGIRTAVIAAANQAEAALVPGITVIAANSLAQVAAWLRGGTPPYRQSPGTRDDDGPVPAGSPPDLADVLGQEEVRRALEVCAAGGHHLSMVGPAGTSAAMLAERLPTILPALETAEALEVTSIHSVAGMLRPGTGLITDPPFAAPRHTCSQAAMLGGGPGLTRPGAVSLAHRGVLFLDQAPEFPRDLLDALRQPLETGNVVIARMSMTATFPARFTLVLAASPCPCAATAAFRETECRCSPAARRRYLGRLSGPLLDRVDVKVPLQRPGREDLPGRVPGERSAVVAQRVAAARQRSAGRLAGWPEHRGG